MFFKNLGKKPLCNNRVKSCFYIGNFCFPLCTRCTSIFLSLFITRYIYKTFYFDSHVSIIIILLLLIPCILDGIAQYQFRVESNNIRRVITGFAYGAGLELFIQMQNQWILLNLINHVVNELCNKGNYWQVWIFIDKRRNPQERQTTLANLNG